MKGILRYLRDYKKESVLAPLFKMLEACFELLIPIVMAHIIDTGIKNQDMGYVLRMCLVMIALGIIGLSCSLTAQYFSAKAATGFGTALRSDLFRHITSLSYNEIDTIGTSTSKTNRKTDGRTTGNRVLRQRYRGSGSQAVEASRFCCRRRRRTRKEDLQTSVFQNGTSACRWHEQYPG